MDHPIAGIVVLVVCPRLYMIYAGMIPAESITAIVGWISVPRVFICAIWSTTYVESDLMFVSVSWILAVIIDVCAFVSKLVFGIRIPFGYTVIFRSSPQHIRIRI